MKRREKEKEKKKFNILPAHDPPKKKIIKREINVSYLIKENKTYSHPADPQSCQYILLISL